MAEKQDFLPYGRHNLDEEDIEAVVELMRSGAMLTGGPEARKFEEAVEAKLNVPHAVVCSNGTTALHLAAIGGDLGPGDLAIVPSITFLSTANVVRMQGADVLFSDVSVETGLMEPRHLEEALAKADRPVKAIFPVHLNGQTADIKSIKAHADEHGAKVISDCCHALGAEYTGGGGKPGDGQYEDMGCFSLHPVKSIAMGEGGLVTTRCEDLANRLRQLRSHDMHWQGKDVPWYYETKELGYNYRATDIQCVLGRSQLAKLDGFMEARHEIADLYDQYLGEMLNTVVPVPRSEFSKSAWHLYPVHIDFEGLGISREKVMTRLRDEFGVGTQVHYIPVHIQPYYKDLYGEQNLPGAESYYKNILSLPIYPGLEADDVAHVCKALKAVLGQ